MSLISSFCLLLFCASWALSQGNAACKSTNFREKGKPFTDCTQHDYLCHFPRAPFPMPFCSGNDLMTVTGDDYTSWSGKFLPGKYSISITIPPSATFTWEDRMLIANKSGTSTSLLDTPIIKDRNNIRTSFRVHCKQNVEVGIDGDKENFIFIVTRIGCGGCACDQTSDCGQELECTGGLCESAPAGVGNSVQCEETEDLEAEAPETEAPETEAPETEDIEAEAPEMEDIETEAPETEDIETEAPKRAGPRMVE